MKILPQISLIPFLAGTIAVISASLSLFFGWRLGDSVIDSIVYATMFTVISVIEFAMPRLIIEAYTKNLSAYFFSTLAVLLVTIRLSIAASFGWQSQQLAQYERQARLESDAYQSWQQRRGTLQVALDNTPIVNTPSLKSEQLQLQREVNRILSQTAYNSNNRSTGRSVNQMTFNCTKDSWYSRQYCSKIHALRATLTQIDSQLVFAHTRQQLMRQLDEVNNAMPTNASVDSQLPAIANVSTAFDLDAIAVKTNSLVVFATIFELLGIALFLFNHYSSATQRNSRQPEKVINPAPTPTPTGAIVSLLEKVRELENANRFLLEKLEHPQPSAAISKAIEIVLANHQKGDKLTYSGLSKELHRSNSFVKKLLHLMIKKGLAQRDENTRRLFLS